MLLLIYFCFIYVVRLYNFNFIPICNMRPFLEILPFWSIAPKAWRHASEWKLRALCSNNINIWILPQQCCTNVSNRNSLCSLKKRRLKLFLWKLTCIPAKSSQTSWKYIGSCIWDFLQFLEIFRCSYFIKTQ